MAAEAEAMRPGIVSTHPPGHHRLLTCRGRRQANFAPWASRSPNRGICTLEHEDYFSYRRDPGTGRLAGLVWHAVAPRDRFAAGA